MNNLVKEKSSWNENHLPTLLLLYCVLQITRSQNIE